MPGATHPFVYGQQLGVLVPGAGRIPRLPGPVGEGGPRGQRAPRPSRRAKPRFASSHASVAAAAITVRTASAAKATNSNGISHPSPPLTGNPTTTASLVNRA